MKKIIFSLVLAILLIPMAAQAFQYSIKFKNEPYSKKTYYIGKTKLIMRVVYFLLLIIIILMKMLMLKVIFCRY